MSEQPRQCYICLDIEVRPGPDVGWVSPCRCSGSLAWVHRRCLLRWIRETESSRPGSTAACPQCLTVFVLCPEKGPVVSTLELIDKKFYPLFKLSALMVLGVISLDAACTTVGVLTVAQVHGLEYVRATLDWGVNMEHIAQLHYISYSLIVAACLPWEDYLLAGLRKASQLPVLGAVFPSDAPSRYKIPPPSRSPSKIIVSCVILPTCAKLCGDVLFTSIESNVERFISGGAFYIWQ